MLLKFNEVSLRFGADWLIAKGDLVINARERVCLVGRNGAGKSTVLKLMRGEQLPDDGEVWRKPGLIIGQLPQDLPADYPGTVYDVIAAGLGDVGNYLRQFHQISAKLSAQPDLTEALARCQSELDRLDGWHSHQKIDRVISQLALEADMPFAHLSGGRKRIVLLAQALVQEPELLLLDEPTNHLDIAAIGKLEQFLPNWSGALVFISHDRAFMQHLASRYIDIDRGRLSSFACGYDDYVARKTALLEHESQAHALFDKRLAQEEVWIRQGIKARRTRNEGRVRELKKMRTAFQARRQVTGTSKITVNAGERSAKIVLEAKNLTFAYDQKKIINDFSITIQRGQKIGIIGRNGSGKSTLIRLLLGQLPLQQGQLRLGQSLQIAYFDQSRQSLDGTLSLLENIGAGKTFVEINGKPKHIISYAQDFLFTPERARQPVSSLSGGERNRVLLARLFMQPANVLVLDEPTNDLDIETLELLEELLIDYSGTVLVVSHDRYFLNRVVTHSMVFDDNGHVHTLVGGYDDWLNLQKTTPTTTALPANKTERNTKATARAHSKTLSGAEKRELEQLPASIERLEIQIDQISAQMSQPGFYDGARSMIQAVEAELAQLQNTLQQQFGRWEALEARQAADL